MQQPRWIRINFCEMSCCSIFWMFGPWLSVNPPPISKWPSNIAPVWIRTVLESSNDKTNTESQSSIERLWNVKLQLSGLLWDWFWASCPLPLPSLNSSSDISCPVKYLSPYLQLTLPNIGFIAPPFPGLVASGSSWSKTAARLANLPYDRASSINC